MNRYKYLYTLILLDISISTLNISVITVPPLIIINLSI